MLNKLNYFSKFGGLLRIFELYNTVDCFFSVFQEGTPKSYPKS
jgi:hypothetical protein